MFKFNTPKILHILPFLLLGHAVLVLADNRPEILNPSTVEQNLNGDNSTSLLNKYIQERKNKENSSLPPRTKAKVKEIEKTEIHPAYDPQSANLSDSSNKNNQERFDPRLISGNEADKKGFFDKGDATAFYSKDISLLNQPKLKILNGRVMPLEDDPEENPKLNASDRDSDKKSPQESPKSPTEIVSRFGDPVKEPEIIPEEKSPPSYKGLMAALEIGDDKLAYQYAKQFS